MLALKNFSNALAKICAKAITPSPSNSPPPSPSKIAKPAATTPIDKCISDFKAQLPQVQKNLTAEIASFQEQVSGVTTSNDVLRLMEEFNHSTASIRRPLSKIRQDAGDEIAKMDANNDSGTEAQESRIRKEMDEATQTLNAQVAKFHATLEQRFQELAGYPWRPGIRYEPSVSLPGTPRQRAG